MSKLAKIAKHFEYDLLSVLGDVHNKEWGIGIQEIKTKEYPKEKTFDSLWTLGFGQSPQWLGQNPTKIKYVQSKDISDLKPSDDDFGPRSFFGVTVTSGQLIDATHLTTRPEVGARRARVANPESLFGFMEEEASKIEDMLSSPSVKKISESQAEYLLGVRGGMLLASQYQVDEFWDRLPIKSYENSGGIWIEDKDDKHAITKGRICHVCQNMADPPALDYGLLPICRKCKKGDAVGINVSYYNPYSREQREQRYREANV
jgi:hypothetical protein